MQRTASRGENLPGLLVEGWNVGAVSVKRVRLDGDGAIEVDIRRHGGDPERTIRSMLKSCAQTPDAAFVTGSQSVSRPPWRISASAPIWSFLWAARVSSPTAWPGAWSAV